VLQSAIHTIARRPQVLDAAVLGGLAVSWLSFVILTAPAAMAAGALYSTAAVLVIYNAFRTGQAWRFGLANTVTLFRLSLTCVLAGAGMQATIWSPALGLASALIAALALGLDGVDGWAARRFGTQSRFGARFDMEVDAGFVAALSMLVWWVTPAGAWVLAIGAMRYAFVAAGWFCPWLRADLPGSLRRQTICVIQGIALTIALLPPASGLAAPVTAAALVLLALSFGVDTIWLYRNRRSGGAGR